ncbi:MAG: hypothetical protein PWQ12_586 [Clostridiales bacterium]|nr:hypothetical protein [Clostridiales bacterium]
MDSVRKTQMTIIRIIIPLIGVISLLSIFLLENPKAFILGLLFGTGISLLNFFELANTLRRAVQMPPSKAQTFTTTKYFLRYVITGVVIYISIIAPYINVLGTIVGLMTIKLIILATNLFNDKKYFQNIFRRKEDESNGD